METLRILNSTQITSIIIFYCCLFNSNNLILIKIVYERDELATKNNSGFESVFSINDN